MNIVFKPISSPDSRPLGFHVMTLGKGVPKICFVCGIHGDEITPHYLIQKLCAVEEKLPVSLAIVLDANPRALAVQQRETPDDKLDLNRVFPGNPEGNITERIADALYHYVQEFELIIELHTFERMDMEAFCIIPTADGTLNERALDILAGFEPWYVWKPNIQTNSEGKYKGALGTTLAGSGKPAFVIEFPSVRVLNDKELDMYAERLIRMLSGIGAPVQRNFHLIERIEGKAPTAGLFTPCARLHIEVKPGECIGELFSIENGERTEVCVSSAGILFQIRHRGLVKKDEPLYALGVPAGGAHE
ncbi:succinylglutamate desuccinylase/aspartoacylase family protein [Candidatus Pacearchaeota archaeon]|nr:succinylglutamate desuccinylase/aspartoacylase family protein [Candidatus Pacearchaeota archaeon]